MNMPSKVRIGAVDYALKTVEAFEDDVTLGEFQREEKRIDFISKSPDVDANTIFHEVLHGCYSNAGLDSTPYGRRMEETIVSALTNQIMGVFRDNPALIRYIAKAVKG